VKPEPGPEAQLLTVPQAARALQLPPKSVYALASRGALRGVVRFGRVVRINLARLFEDRRHRHRLRFRMEVAERPTKGVRGERSEGA
jgi:hypothetical protein